MEFTSGSSKPDISSEVSLLINSSNPTLVAAWDLSPPSFAESSKVAFIRNSFESLGPNGDHRIKVPRDENLPGHKYAAVCKVFMAYTNKPQEEYMGTGWLIAPDVVATAGHCVYDSGGPLKYIKVYFGYSGPESVGKAGCSYCYGVTAAAPAEYLKAQAYAHDVGFVRLNTPITNVQPIRYQDTPLKSQATLGVVGYPGERDSGNYLYEHWQDVAVDLASTNMLLTYKIDTTGGQSGSPVFVSSGTSVGVHVAGGYPNYGSVIGQAGNRFDEYLLAIKVKQGYKSDAATIVSTGGKSPPAPGFQMIIIRQGTPRSNLQPSGLALNGTGKRETAFNEQGDSDDLSSSELEESTGDEKQGTERQQLSSLGSVKAEGLAESLFGGSLRKSSRKHGAHKKRTLTGLVLEFPERLRIPESDGPAATPTTADYQAAVQKALDQPDVQTTFFIGFHAPLTGDAQKKVKKLMDSVQSWQAWSSSLCEGKVQEQINEGKLSANPDGQFARSTYRAKVFDFLFRQSTWFAKTFDQNMTQHISVSKVDFHTAILQAVLKGFTVPTSVFVQLEAILQKIGDTISFGKQSNNEKQQYWIMFTRYDYQPITGTVQPVLRVISFSVDQKMASYTSNKVNYTTIDIDLQFVQYQADFIAKVYKAIQKSVDQKLVEAGLKLVQQKEFKVDV